jgi:hypothetical protein
MPVVGPDMVLSSVTMVPAHYTAASSVPSDTASYLRAIQRDYTLNRGYSIGYNFAVDKTGQAWECRGFDIKCAANKGANDTTIAVLCLVDGAEAMNDAMCATFCALGAEAEQRCADSLLVVGHRDIGATACPGDGIYAQVGAGLLEPSTEPEPEPTPPPDPEEDIDMAFIMQNTKTGEIALVYGDGKVTGLAGGDLGGYIARFGDPVPTDPVVFADFAGKD